MSPLAPGDGRLLAPPTQLTPPSRMRRLARCRPRRQGARREDRGPASSAASAGLPALLERGDISGKRHRTKHAPVSPAGPATHLYNLIYTLRQGTLWSGLRAAAARLLQPPDALGTGRGHRPRRWVAGSDLENHPHSCTLGVVGRGCPLGLRTSAASAWMERRGDGPVGGRLPAKAGRGEGVLTGAGDAAF